MLIGILKLSGFYLPAFVSLTLVLILSQPITSFSQTNEKFTVNGTITDASNGESLIGATVFIKSLGTGTSSNLYGFYALTLEAGSYELEFRYISYESKTVTINLQADQTLDLELSPVAQNLEEVVITETAIDENISNIEIGVNKLDINRIRKMPALFGEVDVIKSIQLLPGVTSVGEGASGFNVRGGNVGQNLVLLDEAPVYNSSHLFGFLSVFNPDAVKDVKLYKGGIPARYGGRLSSILDVRMKEGNNKELDVNGGVGLIFSRLAIEAPIVKDKASFIIAGRRSYGDLFAKAFTDVLDDGAALNFWDITMKANYNLNAKNRLFVSGYLGRDKFLFDANQGFSWGSRTTTARWNHIFNKRTFANFTFVFSDYDYSIKFGEDNVNRFDWNSKIRTLDLKPEFTFFANPNNELNFGGEALLYNFEPARAIGVSNGEITNISLEDKRGLETALYLENDQKVNSNLTLRYGARFSHFSYLGPGNYFEFTDSEPGDRRDVISVTRANNWESIASYHNLEPRFSLRMKTGPNSSMKASYNRMVQYVHLISNTTASNPLDVWTPSTNNLKPEKGDQYALGYFKNFGLGNAFETSAEVYYKSSKDQVDYIDGADLLINEFLEGDLLSGKGRAYGLELFVRKNTGKINGWASYTLARTELRVNGINQNQWYPTRFDQTHNLKLVLFYELDSRLSFSANFAYATGTPTTFPNARFEVQGYVIPYVANEGRNNFRIPDYHRLDLSATWRPKALKKNGEQRKNDSYWVFSIYNLYSRRNAFSIYFSQGTDRIAPGQPVQTEATQLSIIGSFFPSVSYNFKF